LSLADINSLLSGQSTQNTIKTEVNNNEIAEHKDHNVLDSEASRLFESFSALKNQQKGFLSNLVKESPKQDSLPFVNKGIPSKIQESSNQVENMDANSNNPTDNTLSEIEKQINLLNSLNANNK